LTNNFNVSIGMSLPPSMDWKKATRFFSSSVLRSPYNAAAIGVAGRKGYVIAVFAGLNYVQPRRP
jgi:hypothetical protein